MSAQGPPPPGAMPFTPQQIQQMIAMEAQKRGMTIPEFQEFQRRQVEEAAAKEGMSVQEFVQMKQEEMRQQAMRAQQEQQQQQGQGQQQPGQGPPEGKAGEPQQTVTQIPIHNPPPPKPEALAVAKFLRGQDLKLRTCIFEGQRKDMFKGEHYHSNNLASANVHSQTRISCIPVRRLQEGSSEGSTAPRGVE